MDYLETCDYLYNQIPMFEKQERLVTKRGWQIRWPWMNISVIHTKHMLLFMWQAPTAKVACRTP